MPKSLAQIQKQIAKLEEQADQIKKREMGGVIARIKEAIAHYNLTAADLGLAGGRAARKGAAAKTGSKAGAKRAGRKAGASKIKFRDDAGNTWTGRGRRPQWFLDAIASGKTPEQLLADR